MLLATSLLVGCAAPAADESAEPSPAAGEERTAEAGQALSAPRDAIDCGFNHNRTCKSSGPLPNSAHYRSMWDPCYGGEFSWSATVNFEQGYDFLCVDGTASVFGCSNSGKLTGNTTYTGHANGLIPVEIFTDSSMQSAGIVSLTATCDEPLFTGIWAPSATASSQQLHRGLNWTQLNTKISDLVAVGLRLSKVELYYTDTTSGYAYFDALFDAGSGGWGFNAGITYAQLQSWKTTNAAAGLILSDVEAQQTASGVVYIAVFKAGTATQQLFDGLATDFQAWAAPYLNDDYKVTTLEAYQGTNGTTYGTHRLTAVLSRAGGSKNTTGEWSIVLDADYPSLAKLWKEKLANGLTLARVESRLLAGVRYYDAVFQKSANATDFAPSTRLQQFSEKMDENKLQGWALVDFDRVKGGYTSSAPMGEELPITNEYPAVPPEWAARAHTFMRPPGDPNAGGYTLALSRDGELLGVTSSGDIGNGTRLTPEAHWDYYSNAKTLTGLAALKLAEQKGYNIHTQTILPLIASRLDPTKIGSPTAGWDLWDITIWDALTHNSKFIETGGCNEPLSERNIIATANLGTVPAYSGANPCMLRLMIEEQSGETFEGFFRKYITMPVGIHDMDCTKDPEHDEVLRYTIARGQTGAPGVTDHVVNHQCSAGGFIGTAMALLNVINGTRTPGVFTTASLNEFRAAPMTFYPKHDSGNQIWLADMAGGDGVSMGIHLVQFPEDPFTNTTPNIQGSTAWQHGVQAVFLSNFYGIGADPIVGLMSDDPQ
ncbi:Hypothetical protein A7982_01603 [Minicystis rosea]|nr:Hypothetical protein A7982_01603 [Minicystis rosea]